MKKYMSISVLMLILSFVLLTQSADAQKGKGMKGNGTSTHKCANFVDANNDGKCDNFVDANNDGKCDNATGTCTGTGTCDGTKKGNGSCKGTGEGTGCKGTKCSTFVDANNDGKCDNYLDYNNDGKCDNCTSTCTGTCDGTKKNNANCSGNGKKGNNLKKNCGNSCTTKNTGNTNNVTLDQNAPNPVSGTTKITFNLKSAGDVKVVLSDNLGNPVKDIYNGNLSAGNHEVEMNVNGLNPGNYFYSVYVAGKVETKQMVIVK